MSLLFSLSSAGSPASTSTSTSTSTISVGLIDSLFSVLTRLASEGEGEGEVEIGEATASATATATDVPGVSSFTSSAGNGDDDDDDEMGSCFLLPAVRATAAAVDADSLALAWRMNIASMPSLRFCTGSMTVGDSTPTLPTSPGTA